MRSRNTLFLLIAIYFVFTYPINFHQLSLDDTIDWNNSNGRAMATFLYPIWFMIVYATYQRIAARGIIISNYFFWVHVLITILPTFFLNFPFVRRYYHFGAGPGDLFFVMSRVNNANTFYLIVQLVFYSFLLFKLLRKPMR